MTASLATLTRVELAKLARQPTVLVLAGIFVVYLLVVGVSFYALLSAPAVEGFDRDSFLAPMRAAPLAFTMSLFASTVYLLLIVLAATIVAQEFSRGTLRTLLLAGATRTRFGLAKIVTLALTSLLLAALGTAFSVGALAAFGAALGERLLAVDASAILWTFVALLVGLVGWSVLTVAATLWRGSLGTGIATAAGLLIVGDVATGLFASMGDVGILVSRLLPNSAFGALATGAPPPAEAWAWILPNLAFYLVFVPYLALRKLAHVDAVAMTRA